MLLNQNLSRKTLFTWVVAQPTEAPCPSDQPVEVSIVELGLDIEMDEQVLEMFALDTIVTLRAERLAIEADAYEADLREENPA